MDPYLYDYKDKGFVNDHNGALTKDSITDAEEQFVNMTVAFWQESNDAVPMKDYIKYNSKGEGYSYELINLMKKYLDTGNILDAGLIAVSKKDSSDTSGHALNIVSYEETDNPDVTIFYVYDSNLPDINEFQNGLPMIVKKKGDSFTYTYTPRFKSKIFTNDPDYADKFGLVVCDEDFNILNDLT